MRRSGHWAWRARGRGPLRRNSVGTDQSQVLGVEILCMNECRVGLGARSMVWCCGDLQKRGGWTNREPAALVAAAAEVPTGRWKA